MRYLTAGESHGPQLTTIIEGMPSNVPISVEKINEQLARRQKGYGRGNRMNIEKDQVHIVSGIRFGKTTGAPIALVIENKDWKRWQDVMSPDPDPKHVDKRRVSRPRPGHADLNGGIKYHHRDLRNVLERSSARETAARVAVGAVARQLLSHCGIEVAGHVVRIGEAEAEQTPDISLTDLREQSEKSPVRCIYPQVEEKMMALIDKAKAEGDSIGGVVEVIIEGVPVGLGSHVQWDRKLDARLAQAVMSIQAFKGVELGIGFKAAERMGSQVHDEIAWSKDRGYYRKTNRLGGFEGGMTNGAPIVIRGVMKPIPTLYKPLKSVDIDTKEPFEASIERTDNCAVPAASVVVEGVVSWEVARALCDKFSADTFDELQEAVAEYRDYAREF